MKLFALRESNDHSVWDNSTNIEHTVHTPTKTHYHDILLFLIVVLQINKYFTTKYIFLLYNMLYYAYYNNKDKNHIDKIIEYIYILLINYSIELYYLYYV